MKKILRKLTAMLSVLMLLSALTGCSLLGESDVIKLQKSDDKDFVVLNLSDPQLDRVDTEVETVNIRFLKNTIEQMIEEVKPDLITISGDIHYTSQKDYIDVYKYFADYIDSFEIPWSVVWGNHDNELSTLGIDNIEEEFHKHKYFTYCDGDESLGSGNYVIAVEENNKTVSALIMMDTHGSVPDSTGRGSYGKLSAEQLTWYEQKVEELKKQGCNSNALILHVPIYAYNYAFDEAFTKDILPADITYEESFDSKYWNEGYDGSYGLPYEGICSHTEDDGVMEVIERLGATKLVLCGHDHSNSFSIPYHGTRLMYALKTGRGAYYHNDLNGGTEIRISSDGEITAKHIFVPAEDAEK